MPVVNPDLQDPAVWADVSVAWGGIRDGDTLRFARMARGTSIQVFMVQLSDWQEGCKVRSLLLEDLDRGARLTAGLPPSRVMLRTLISPLSDPHKSAEIWPGLLDAVLPFPLESCIVAFGESRPRADGGLSCLAAAIRLEDLEAECRLWADLGLDPECLVPEALMLGGEWPGVSVWIGTGRAVFVARDDEGFSASGGAKDPSREGKTLRRFLDAMPGEAGPVWLGPGGDDAGNVLEEALARSGLGLPGARMMNLRADPMAHPGLLRRARRTRRTLLALAALLLGLSVGLPMLLRAVMQHHQQESRLRMSALYQSVTGEQSPFGQERLLLERWIDREWGAVRAASDRIFATGIRPDMSQVLALCSRLDLPVRSWSQDAEGLRLSFAADRPGAERLAMELGHFGWQGELTELEAGGWRFNGRREP